MTSAVIEDEHDRTGSLNTPPLKGLSSEERTGSERDSAEEEEVELPGDGRNRSDGDQRNEPGEHRAIPVREEEVVPTPMQEVGMPPMEEVPVMGMPPPPNVYAVDLPAAPPSVPLDAVVDEAFCAFDQAEPSAAHAAAAVVADWGERNRHHRAEGEHTEPATRGGESRNLVDPAVFRAVLQSKIAASAGVFDWNRHHRSVHVEEILIPDDMSEVTGDVTLPVCLMDKLDWEDERRRRGFPGQIELSDPRSGGGGPMAANDSCKISVLTGIGRDDDISALGLHPAGTPASAAAGGRGEGEWEVRGVGKKAAPDDVRDIAAEEEEREEEIVVGRTEETDAAAPCGAGAEAAAAEAMEPVVVGVLRRTRPRNWLRTLPASSPPTRKGKCRGQTSRTTKKRRRRRRHWRCPLQQWLHNAQGVPMRPAPEEQVHHDFFGSAKKKKAASSPDAVQSSGRTPKAKADGGVAVVSLYK